jgi:Domain of unknown function (DUF5658)
MSIGFTPYTAVCLALALNLVAANAAVAAQQDASRDAVPPSTLAAPNGAGGLAGSGAFIPTLAAGAAKSVSLFPPVPAPPSRRPAALVPLYISLASLEALDVHATFDALGRGGVEANPIMRPLIGSPAAVVAVKAALTGVMIASSEKLWKKNRAAAVLLMVGMNGAYAAVVAHNYSIAR